MKSILENIKDAVCQIEWTNETKKEKAIQVCEYIYNLYIYDGGDFYQYRSLSKSYFQSIIKTQNYVYEIKNLLIESGILEIQNSYDVKRHISKGYRFNQDLIKGNYVVLCGTKVKNEEVLCGTKDSSIIKSFADSKYSTPLFKSFTNPLYHICGTKLKPFIYKGLQEITFDENVHNWINHFTLKREDILVDDEIKDEYVDIIFDESTYRYGLEKALCFAHSQGLNLIGYKDKYYIDSVDRFILRKSNDLKLIYSKSVFDIENGIFRISRNETNRRLDYNLTNIKSDLLDFIIVDGERLVELDIANAQFSILSFITNHLDESFIKSSQDGSLYSHISKDHMFRIAFDKVKKDQDHVRSMFSKTMEFIDGFKSEWGYKCFSNLLQNVESLIMIDGLMDRIIDLDIRVYPVHDGLRVRESDALKVLSVMRNFFDEIGFKCRVRIKSKKQIEKIEILYKGYEKHKNNF